MSASSMIIRQMTYRNLAVAFHNTDLNILRTSLHDFQETLHCELDGVVSAQVILVVLLQELPHGF